MEGLTYGLKTMQVEPANVTMSEVAGQLSKRLSVVVHLEPGDGTHYGLLLVPAHSATLLYGFGRWGVPPNSADRYLIAIKLEQRHMHGCWLLWRETTEPHHVAPLTENEWSREFLAWWFNQLREEMDQ